ncbi:trypsin beta-like [Daphnia pulex]|uniref:trypsin beta-like n=1 Tax=Daphnia pulex TaxID=6669 RepID=UPI001EDDCFE5|nr:trypsin beta-like [Daphnia pulex]
MKLTTTIPIFLCCLLHNALAGENDINDQERILGGTKAKEGEFPFIVSITTNGEHLCAGFIYNQRFIVTTVTCVQNLSPSQVSVVVGQLSLISSTEPYERRYQVVSIIPHENYDANLGLNNLAVIETSSSMAFTAGHVDFICYNEDNTTFPEATVMGWGATQEGGLPSIDLLKASVTISTECVVYGSEEYQPNYMICAGSDTASPCHYDEGSPLVQDNIVVGVASRNTGCKELFLPTLYTRLSSYYAWLNRNAGQQPPACSAA